MESYIKDIIIIVLLIIGGRFLLSAGIRKLVNFADDGDDDKNSDLEKRAKTLGGIIKTTGNIVIYTIALFLVLSMFGVDIRPILTGAGIIGLAVGFGSQALVKDMVSGLFILIENQYAVGDRVKLGSAEGIVEKITIRSTVLKGKDGERFYVSNGNIKDVVNFSKKQK